jgi:LysM repeat protein
MELSINGLVWRRKMNRLLIFLIVFSFSLAACNSSEPPPNPEPDVAEVSSTDTPTPAPTVAVSTPTPVPATPTAPPPSPTPTIVPTNTPVPTPTAQVYEVEEGDTLLGIAVEFETTIEALAEANGIGVNDFLQLGQRLIIPVEGATAEVVPATETVVEGATPASAANEPAQNGGGSSSTGSGTSGNAPAAPPPVTGGAPIAIPTVLLPSNVNPLTGLVVADPNVLQRRPLMVRVGNDVGARQGQIGLNSADMVYEDITEWWVTRFTAIYLSTTPPAAGPVRSARLLNVQLVPQYQGALAHSGGSDAVRWEISQAPLVNLDEFYNAAPYFYRPNEGWQTRLAINTQAARDYMAQKGWEAPVKLPGFLFSETIEGGEPGQTIYIPYPRSTSFTEWRYDPDSGKYRRWINGFPLNDVASGQVTASNVVVYFADHQATDIVEDTNGATSIRIIMNGFNAAWLFRDGKLFRGFWQTDGSRPPFFTYPDDRKPYPLKPGNTWVEVVPLYYKIGLNSPDEASASP